MPGAGTCQIIKSCLIIDEFEGMPALLESGEQRETTVPI